MKIAFYFTQDIIARSPCARASAARINKAGDCEEITDTERSSTPLLQKIPYCIKSLWNWCSAPTSWRSEPLLQRAEAEKCSPSTNRRHPGITFSVCQIAAPFWFGACWRLLPDQTDSLQVQRTKDTVEHNKQCKVVSISKAKKLEGIAGQSKRSEEKASAAKKTPSATGKM